MKKNAVVVSQVDLIDKDIKRERTKKTKDETRNPTQIVDRRTPGQETPTRTTEAQRRRREGVSSS